MKILLTLVFSFCLPALAEAPVQGEFRVVGVVKRLEGDAVVLRLKNRNIRISRRFFENRENLSVGEVATARYTMTFGSFGARKPSAK